MALPPLSPTRALRRCPSVFLACLLLFSPVLLLGAATVSDVRVAQRSGTNLVDIYYNLSGVDDTATVSVAVSDDSGSSYAITPSSLTGHVGSGVTNGSNRHIVWDAGAQLPDFVSTTMRVRVTASVQAPTEGFAYIPAGSFEMGDNSARDPCIRSDLSDRIFRI